MTGQSSVLLQYRKEGERIVPAAHSLLQYEGRIDWTDPEQAVWVFPATYVRIRFTGAVIRAVVTNRRMYWDNYLGYFLDGEEGKCPLKPEGSECLSWETRGDGIDGKGVHELVLFKRQDACHTVCFHGFLLEETSKILCCDPLPERCIEVYGDSVSAGEVSEAVAFCGQPDPEHNGEYSNSYYSYAWMTARLLGARLHDIAQGGIATMNGTGWFDEPNRIGMESVYDAIRYYPPSDAYAKWNFRAYVPQVVIVALGQNDSHPDDFFENPTGEAAKRWCEHYKALLGKIRAKRPNAHIICITTLLEHGKAWDEGIDRVVKSMGDDKIHHYMFARNGSATKGHLRIPEAEEMAKELAAYIKGLGENIWQDTTRLHNVMRRAKRGEKLTIGFLGGSITQGCLASMPKRCYAYRTFEWWKRRFPKAEFTYINAGIGATDSHFASARVQEDLLEKKPDLVFVEFSVNDRYEEHFAETYEGLVRRILDSATKPAVVLLYNRYYENGSSAQEIHRNIARNYLLPGVGLGDRLYPEIVSGKLEQECITPDGLHPNDEGHERLAGYICEFLESEVRKCFELSPYESSDDQEMAKKRAASTTKLPAPVTDNRYENAKWFRNRNIEPESISGFERDDTPQEQIADIFRYGWTAVHEGAQITFRVKASCIALQFRRTVHHPAHKALAIVDGNEDGAILLDGDFDEDWGDCLYLQNLCEESETSEHTVTVRLIKEEKDAPLPFYLVSILTAGTAD